MPNIMVFKALPLSVEQGVKGLGSRIRIARKRRGWTVAETALKAGINRNTLNALEVGKPTVAIGTLVAVLWVLGLDSTLQSVAHPDQDAQGKALEASRRPQRVRKRQASKEDYDF